MSGSGLRTRFNGAVGRKQIKPNPHHGPTNPDPAQPPADGVQRFGSMIELKPHKENLYRQLHANVWPEVVAAIKNAHIRNYNIYLAEVEGKKYLFSFMEYTGDDLEKDMASIAADPTTRDKWWPITNNCQRRLPGTPTGEQWKPLERLMFIE